MNFIKVIKSSDVDELSKYFDEDLSDLEGEDLEYYTQLKQNEENLCDDLGITTNMLKRVHQLLDRSQDRGNIEFNQIEAVANKVGLDVNTVETIALEWGLTVE